MAGIMLFQYSTSSGRSTASVVASLNSSVQNPFVGMISIALACLISGFASVYTEKIVKKASTSIWASNLQLALCSILPASIVILASLVSSKDIRNPMDNFGFWAWAVVVLNVFGGLLVGMVVKYADSILKSFATSVALILTCAMAVLFLGAQMSLLSTAAVAIVVGSIINYSKPDVGKSSLVLTSPSESTLPIEGQQNDQYPYYITYLQ
jgi:UDP-sugar transporter A1/2/3